MKTVRGVILGKTIVLDQDVGLPDGQKVEVAIQLISNGAGSEAWGEGLCRAAGGLAVIAGLDEYMEQILAERKVARFREAAE